MFGVPWVGGDRPKEVAGQWGTPEETGQCLWVRPPPACNGQGGQKAKGLPWTPQTVWAWGLLRTLERKRGGHTWRSLSLPSAEWGLEQFILSHKK